MLCSNLDLGLEVVDEATSPAPPLPFDSPFDASFNAAAGFMASSTTLKLRRNAALALSLRLATTLSGSKSYENTDPEVFATLDLRLMAMTPFGVLGVV